MNTINMVNYEVYVRSLEELAERAFNVEDQKNWTCHAKAAIGEQPAERIRHLVHLDVRRRAGAFFTNSSIVKRVLSGITSKIDHNTVIVDPTCGVGDLLIAFASKLPIGPDMDSTINQWSKQLCGMDIHPEFVRATKARLLLAALLRMPNAQNEAFTNSKDAFPNIRQSDALQENFAHASHLCINPPYNMMIAPAECEWASGKVSSAAIFFEACLRHSAPNTSVSAILPDVLRSGTRYEKWRKVIEALADVESVEVYGQFDKWTDIDVFILRAKSSSRCLSKASWSSKPASSRRVLSDLFDICVGAVVPYRDVHEGEFRNYIYARLLTGKMRFNADTSEQRRYLGTIVMPPFVVVRRTSRPDTCRRGFGTIIVGTRAVAVENHLLVLKPHDGSLESCEALQVVLDDHRTDDWLDTTIRCRHLTVSVLRSLPWWKDESTN